MKANFHRSWYLVEREFDMEGKKSLFVSAPKGKISLNQKDSIRAHMSLGDICSQCD